METNIFTTLPEHIQIALATGYLGYSIARAGYRKNERKDDVLYGILVYGLVGYMCYDFVRPLATHFFLPAVAASVATAATALIWRKKLSAVWYKFLHTSAISNEDNIPDVWSGIIQRTDVAPTQVSVHMKNGTTLKCHNVPKFRNAPFPFYYADSEGNIAIYATHKQAPSDSEIRELPNVRDTTWGDRLTYVPKEEISYITVRLKKK
jgi:hypothetical protein